jgi:hypothetical protein
MVVFCILLNCELRINGSTEEAGELMKLNDRRDMIDRKEFMISIARHNNLPKWWYEYGKYPVFAGNHYQVHRINLSHQVVLNNIAHPVLSLVIWQLQQKREVILSLGKNT